MDHGSATGQHSLPPPLPADPPARTPEVRPTRTAGYDWAGQPDAVGGDLVQHQQAGLSAIPATPTGQLTHRFAHLPGLSLMAAILTAQAALSAQFLRVDRAFGGEARDLAAGRLEWAHWLHGASLPGFPPSWFSGSPVIYPPVAAVADRLGGLTGARILSLAFMLAATCLLRGTTARLFGRRPAFFAAALFAVIAPTLHVGTLATYDSMALFLMALAGWCACGARTRDDATGWMLACAGALALANATDYASALFDPVVVLMAVLGACPRPGGKAAMRRGALLLTCLAGTLAMLIRIGGQWYITGISQTTTMRPSGTDAVRAVLTASWSWTGVVAIAALAGLVASLITENDRSVRYLITALAATILLIPIEQARVQTTASLARHLDFGAWFACIAAGYALGSIATWPKARSARVVVAACAGVAIASVAALGIRQAQDMINWPGSAHLIAFLRPLTLPGGRITADTATADAQANSQHYFSLVNLDFSATPVIDRDVNSAGPVRGVYIVRAYRPGGGTG